ncbi:conserved hypothetical protein [Parvibaculum lavamentivorans DS-1]|uniref:Uncharacterized protein n=1 Tax=Parvibaculum lavamentivorans (strain DS-1 / DSM 13023 / NCIMB 13966) TaxID=402881 RepID=A7HUS6_PARL1|nr:conserved hypothetical protein [Parvibaculum lavamentivorans DS-1]
MTTLPSVVILTNVKAELLYRARTYFRDDAFAEAVLWKLPAPLKGSSHSFKYRLALVISDECVLRYDNEAGKGDHRHIGEREEPYEFVDPETLLADFSADVERMLE